MPYLNKKELHVHMPQQVGDHILPEERALGSIHGHHVSAGQDLSSIEVPPALPCTCTSPPCCCTTWPHSRIAVVLAQQQRIARKGCKKGKNAEFSLLDSATCDSKASKCAYSCLACMGVHDTQMSNFRSSSAEQTLVLSAQQLAAILQHRCCTHRQCQ